MKYLSLCMATNGIEEWVFPSLESIFKQGADNSDFEVIVTDNGDNLQFEERMREYCKDHTNLIYKKTDAFLFQNQIEALRLGTGEYLKFINHRSIFEEGALEWMLSLIKGCINEKPIIYLSNGTLRLKKTYSVNTFDGFVRGLGHMASWTTGVGVWKGDFERIPLNHVYNKISPHSDVLFWIRDRNEYIIDDWKWSHDIDESHVKKGSYDLYKAFAVEEFLITLQLYLDGYITSKTLKKVKKSYMKCVAMFYAKFNILKEPCSYMINNFEKNMDIFISKRRTVTMAYLYTPIVLYLRIINRNSTKKDMLQSSL